MKKIASLLKANFLRFYAAVFFSELGGYLTNTAIYIHIFEQTDGNKFYLGLAQVLFVGPLAIGSFLGGALGEYYDRRKLMLICESMNLFLVFGLIASSQSVLPIIFFRAIIVIFAGIYNPCRQAMIQDVVAPHRLKYANAAITAVYAILHALGPLVGAYAYRHFQGVKEIFFINLFTYLAGFVLLLLLKYQRPSHSTDRFSFQKVFPRIGEGISHIFSRSDLSALLKNFSVAGICMGVFYPSLLPFIQETFNGDETVYGKCLLAFGVGGILGGALGATLMRFFSKGKILVVMSLVQAFLLLVWTLNKEIYLNYAILVVWGMGMMSIVTTYISYIQTNVSHNFQARTFSLYDQSTYLSIVLGALVVTVTGQFVSATTLFMATAIFALLAIGLRIATKGMQSLYWMET